jgi:hypothetical protein
MARTSTGGRDNDANSRARRETVLDEFLDDPMRAWDTDIETMYGYEVIDLGADLRRLETLIQKAVQAGRVPAKDDPLWLHFVWYLGNCNLNKAVDEHNTPLTISQLEDAGLMLDDFEDRLINEIQGDAAWIARRCLTHRERVVKLRARRTAPRPTAASASAATGTRVLDFASYRP